MLWVDRDGHDVRMTTSPATVAGEKKKRESPRVRVPRLTNARPLTLPECITLVTHCWKLPPGEAANNEQVPRLARI